VSHKFTYLIMNSQCIGLYDEGQAIIYEVLIMMRVMLFFRYFLHVLVMTSAVTFDTLNIS